MNNAITSNDHSIIESVLIEGDLARLTPQRRNEYYLATCKSLGLNPLTKPFAYLVLGGKMVLYALRDCTDQLRKLHDISVEELIESERDGVFIVTAKVRNGKGRYDIAKGALHINGLKGDALANALMRCETKAKRRATLSICGLGFLDESEIETVPTAARKPTIAPSPLTSPPLPPHDPQTGEIMDDGLDIPASLDRRPKVNKPDPEVILKWIDDKLASIGDQRALESFWNDRLVPRLTELLPPDRDVAIAIYHRHEARLT
jgi:hypothetical protein